MPKGSGIAARRLSAQQVARPAFAVPLDLVVWLGAVQAQDYAAAKWAVGLRLAGAATDASADASYRAIRSRGCPPPSARPGRLRMALRGFLV
jgi:hypothetical protein